MEPLEHTPDHFGGIIVAAQHLPENADEFCMRLRLSLDTWRSDGRRLIWVDVPRRLAHLIPIATAEGFLFHHSDEDELTMVCRLVEAAYIPLHATHYIGVGGVVINEREELLVVCERHRRTAQPYYKLPGGALLPGEHLVDAVLREVHEETGVNARFEALVCLRHWHGYRYGKSDIYFVCRLSPLSQDVTMQVEEIEECFWMPVADYFASDLVSVFNKRIVRAALASPGVIPEWIDGYGDPSRYEFFMPAGAGGSGA